jgi:hypothetical protein
MSRGKSPAMRRLKRGLSTRGIVVKLYIWKGPMGPRRAAVSEREQVA